MISPRISLATRLNLAIALPLVLAFFASAAAYVAIERVSRDTKLAVASTQIQPVANELTAAADRRRNRMPTPRASGGTTSIALPASFNWRSAA